MVYGLPGEGNHYHLWLPWGRVTIMVYGLPRETNHHGLWFLWGG